MSEESEIESIVPSALNTGTEPGTLVEVKFQKNTYQIQKYLEAEPKALGVTQIMLGLFIMSITLSITEYFDGKIINAVSSSANIIAGSVAIAAKNLHLPRLKACLGLQVVVCVASLFSILFNLGEMGSYPVINFCWQEELNSTDTDTDKNTDTQTMNVCDRYWFIVGHIKGIEILVHVTQIALSVTLAAFCCKVIQCCSPRKNVPVIMVNTLGSTVMAESQPI
ncbi:membrane-spanning 4-domains subfamily A member 4A-like isoform X2 [Tachysurus fulvidraco]|uniref:membrane-spanning 4-domains subfamily A member 4A-like isoform X2 n=1 Tax=Tachysurus fulvidraco TaxID=1234273 RepID=UPI000F510438|nr:membrane-spanning 4-domains subfamily A member 4A-like isoform X2 [Tachysurus fulvidraco]